MSGTDVAHGAACYAMSCTDISIEGDQVAGYALSGTDRGFQVGCYAASRCYQQQGRSPYQPTRLLCDARYSHSVCSYRLLCDVWYSHGLCFFSPTNCSDMLYGAIILRAYYAVPSTDMAYGGTASVDSRAPLAVESEAVSGTKHPLLSYALAMRCPVLMEHIPARCPELLSHIQLRCV
eukprot:3925745-Rhodomonas_salina.5